jgi:hypothetical protein
LNATTKRDIVFLVADQGIKQVLKGFLSRAPHQRLGCGEFSIDSEAEIRVEPTRDSGVYGKAHELLKPYLYSHHRAVVVLDADWDGSPGADAIGQHIGERMAQVWKEYAVIVIEPELEAWLMNDNAHLARIFGCPENYREILADAGWWPVGSPKPPRPKEALEYLMHRHKRRATRAAFGKLAEAMSVRQCQDSAFLQLRDKLREWFPAVRP